MHDEHTVTRSLNKLGHERRHQHRQRGVADQDKPDEGDNTNGVLGGRG